MENVTTLEELRQLTSKVLAVAVLELFPETQLVASQVTPHGFFYDFVFPFAFTPDMLSLLEERMGQIAREKRPFKTIEMVPISAANFFAHQKQRLLAERAKNAQDSLLSIFQMGEFSDLCEEEITGELSAFRLLEISQKQSYQGLGVTRITGTAFFEKDELKEFLKNREEFAQKDHLVLGEDLELIACLEEQVLWQERGEKLKELLIDLWKKELSHFACISTRNLGPDLTENVCKYFLAMDKKERRFVEFVQEISIANEGWERGLLTAERPFMDRVHVFCAQDELLNICISSLQIIWKVFKILDFKFRFVFCSSSSEQVHKREADQILEEALRSCGAAYSIESSRGAAAPAIELRVRDGMGQEWPASFLSVDCRELVAEEVVVFSLFNSLERLIALLLENSEGELPLFLAPEQVRVVGVKENEYATEISQLLKEAGLRVSLDIREEKLAKRLHEALCRKIPWLIVVGEREKRDQLVTVRSFSSPDAREMSVESFIQKMLELIKVENQ